MSIDNTDDAPAAAPPRLSPPPRRILVKSVNWLGDVVMSLPALRALRRAFPTAHLALLIRHELAPLFDGAQWLDEVIPYRIARGPAGLSDRARIVGALRARRFDLAVLMPNSFDCALWAALAGIGRRAGFAVDARGPLLTHRAAPNHAALNGHQVHYWLTMVEQTLGVRGDAADFRLTPAPAHREKIALWLRDHRHRERAPIALAPGAAYGPAKEWPAASYAELIDLLAREHDRDCVLVGAPSERPGCEAIAARAKSGAMVAAGETDAGELLALLSLAAGFAGNDSGAMHVAAAAGIATVGIFGSTDPARTGPLGINARVAAQPPPCSPCFARTCRFGHYDCLVQLPPRKVAAALEELGALRPTADARREMVQQ